MKNEKEIMRIIGESTMESLQKDNTLLGNVLAIGSKLVAEGRIPQDVIDSRGGAYALCLATRATTDVRVLHTGDAVEVGRSPGGEGQVWEIDDPWMSRRHFRFSVGADGLPVLTNLGSKNGTFVNDQSVDGCAKLKRGDVIRAGSSSFLLF